MLVNLIRFNEYFWLWAMSFEFDTEITDCGLTVANKFPGLVETGQRLQPFLERSKFTGHLKISSFAVYLHLFRINVSLNGIILFQSDS